MIQKLRNSFALKSFSLVFILVFVIQVLQPLKLYALTSGPTQPEYDHFTPVGASDLVNLFSGDFSYNLPLLNVPGPNGGYPINIGYQSGIGMEDEAGWVGLGWSLNPGAINRSKRGIPDDFKGDKIHNELYIKPNVTIGVGVRADFPEIFGADTKKLGASLDYQFYWNNYRGTGHTLGVGLSATMGEKGKYNASLGLNLTVSSSDGASVSPSVSYSHIKDQHMVGISTGLTYSSRQGLTDIGIVQTQSIRSKEKMVTRTNNEGKSQEFTGHRSYASGHGVGVHFSSNGNVPNLSADFNGMSAALSVSLQAGTITNVEVPLTLSGQFSVSWLDDKSKKADVKAYGYNYTAEREKLAGDDERAIFDFSKEKDFPVHPKVPSLPVPQFNHDQLFVSGHGVSGSFRPYRSDHGLLYDPTSESDFGSVTAGVEVGSTTTADAKLGINIGGMYAYGYSGKWKTGLDNFNRIRNYKLDYELLTGERGYTTTQPYHYQFNNEINIVPTDYLNPISGEVPIDISFSPALGDVTSAVGAGMGSSSVGAGPPTGDLSVVAQVTLSGLDNNNHAIKQSFKTKNAIEYLTRIEKEKYLDYSTRAKHIYKLGEYPLITPSYSSGYPKQIEQSSTLLNTGTVDHGIGHHIGEYTIQNEGGVKYTYGLPSYNIKEEMLAFSIDADQGMSYPKTVTYTPGTDDKMENGKGNDHLYSSNVVPHYATTYLLTEIKGPDYVDLTGDGITEDDLGYFVKFNYSPLTTNGNYFGWRMPYKENTAYYEPGYLQYTKDSKAKVMYGEKEVWYLNSIETKTHIAVFKLSDRADGHGVLNRQGQPETSLKLKKLDKIELYSKVDIDISDSPLPIKSVCFEYTYDLCGNVPNNILNLGGSYTSDYSKNPHHCYASSETQPNNNQNKGKLTLKKIYFTYGKNNKGKSSPYYFDYYERDGSCNINSEHNPDYSIGQVDRWGNYRPDNINDPLDRLKNEENSYVDQNRENKDVLDKQVSVWSLKEVTNPSGSKMKINYETDDYSHIQDRVAGEMCEVIGVGSSSENHFFTNPSNVTEEVPLYNSTGTPYSRIYFKPEYPLSANGAEATAEVQKYIADLNSNYVYFKTFLKLGIPKDLSSHFISDYVDGYCKIKGVGYEDISNGEQIMGFNSADGIYDATILANLNLNRVPYIIIDPLPVHHPFSYSGWQHLKNHRPDILSDNYGAATFTPVGIIAAIFSIIESIGELFAGFYNIQYAKGHCRYIKEERPSYIRLSSPDNKKYGGGHRVKSIEMNDDWASAGGTSSTYGQKYFYQMENGESSGTASYEPLTGGNEISLRYPHYFSDNMLGNETNNYLEYPFGESFYPAASIGYRRVLVEDLHLGQILSNGEKVTKNNSGVNEYVFYTAKEFPILTGKTTEVQDGVKQHLIFPIPLIGMFSLKSDNYTQGYKIELNSMHGQIRSMAAYDADYDANGDGIWDNVSPVDYTSKTVYTYKTQQAYNPGEVNRLNNEVEVLTGDNIKQDALMGINYDFYTHMEQNSNFAIMAGLDVNLVLVSGFAPVPSFFPSIELSYNQAKMMVSNKIIYKQGVLTKVENYSEGTVTTSENLLWDAETGNVLLSRVSTDYNDHTKYGTVNEPVNDYIYNYDIPAHWSYTEMQGNYTNYRTLMKIEAHPQAATNTSYDSSFVFNPIAPIEGTDKIMDGDILMIYKMDNNELIPAGNELCYWVTNSMLDDGGPGITTPAFTFELLKKSGGKINMSTIASLAFVSPSTTLYAKVITPIRTNQQSTMAGNVVSLADPLSSRKNPFLDAYNSDAVCNQSSLFLDDLTLPLPLVKYFCYNNCQGNPMYGSKSIIQVNGITYLQIKGDTDPNLVLWNAAGAPATNMRFALPAGTTSFHQLTSLGNDEAGFINPVGSAEYTLPAVRAWGNGRGTITRSSLALPMCLDGVLDASSVDFTNDYAYNYTDFSKIGTGVVTNPNKYRSGALGIWRPKQKAVYLVDRKQKGTAALGFKTYTGKDGVYEHYTFYIWRRPENGGPLLQSPWRFVDLFTRYSPYGHNTEVQNALFQYSSTIYGYSESMPTAIVANAAYLEMGYDGFEDYFIPGSATPVYHGVVSDDHNNGHLPITKQGAIDLTLTKGTGHTGDYGLYVDLKNTSNAAYINGAAILASGLTANNTSVINLVKGKTYWISLWVKKNRADVNFTSAVTLPGVSIQDGVTTTDIRLSNQTIDIEGWYKIEGKFTVSAAATSLKIYLLPGQKSSSDIKAYFDDIRVQPFSSEMNTFVYDNKQLYKTAELDANNYATFYVYDEEGTLVQVKKETEKGIVTLQQQRANIKMK